MKKHCWQTGSATNITTIGRTHELSKQQQEITETLAKNKKTDDLNNSTIFADYTIKYKN